MAHISPHINYDVVNNMYIITDPVTNQIIRIPAYEYRDYRMKGDPLAYPNDPQQQYIDAFGALVKQAMGNVSGAIGAPVYTNNTITHGTINNGTVDASTTTFPYTQSYVEDSLKVRMFSSKEQEELLEIKNHVRRYLNIHMPPAFQTSASHQIIVAGGCFASLLNKEPVKDYDVFLLSPIDHHILTEITKVIDSDKIHVGDASYMKNDKIEKTVFFKREYIQYISSHYKNREELVNHFDFRHCCVSYDYSTDKLYISREVYDLIKSKTLVANDIRRNPELWRYEKFLGRGWKKQEIMSF